ncbi:hypothetical protein D3C83_140510 [compost metagenome]
MGHVRIAFDPPLLAANAFARAVADLGIVTLGLPIDFYELGEIDRPPERFLNATNVGAELVRCDLRTTFNTKAKIDHESGG